MLMFLPHLAALVSALWRLSDEPNAAPITASALEESMRALAAERGLDEELVLARQPPETTFASVADDLVQMALMHEGEFSPVCAMLGGVVSQDVLNALGGREEPFVNWFQLDAMQGEFMDRRGGTCINGPSWPWLSRCPY